MKQEFDMVKALHTLTYDLESTSGQYNMGKMFGKCLDKAANAGVEYFAQMTCVYKELRIRKTSARNVVDEWKYADGNQRLFKRLRKLCKEYYANLFDHILGDGIFESETEFGFPLSPENIGTDAADAFKEDLLKDMLRRWKKSTPEH